MDSNRSKYDVSLAVLTGCHHSDKLTQEHKTRRRLLRPQNQQFPGSSCHVPQAVRGLGGFQRQCEKGRGSSGKGLQKFS